jgi:phospholipid/cholesterol/gamma-HCH transport system ATP-binding protein
LARAISLDPMMVMYDEPFTGQDPISMGVLAQLVRRLNDAAGLTSILVSHDVEETLEIADLVYVIHKGKVIERGTPEELSRSTSPSVRQFVSGLPDGPVGFHYDAPSLEEDLLSMRGRY